MYKGKAPDGLEEGFIQLLAFDFPFNFCLLEPPPPPWVPSKPAGYLLLLCEKPESQMSLKPSAFDKSSVWRL